VAPDRPRRRLHELEETRRWIHHVADLDSGEIRTTTLDRTIAPLSRIERLSQLGHRFDPTVLGGPSYRLTPRQPYQASPEASLTVVNSRDYSNASSWTRGRSPREPRGDARTQVMRAAALRRFALRR
jgi:hypothetical protein